MKKYFTHKNNKTVLITALLLELGIGSSQAAIIDVDGVCTLADAITSANTDTFVGGCPAGSGADIIEIISGLSISLNNPLPNIDSDITINGNGSTIQRDPGAPDFRIITSYNQVTLNINDTIISAGVDNYNRGGGIHVFKTDLHLNNCTISGNTGGGVQILNTTNSSINNSKIKNNDGILLPNYGAGLNISIGSVTITDSEISGNRNLETAGGGIQIYDNYSYTYVTINNTTISGNFSNSRGGGIAHLSRGGTIITNILNSTISGNNSNLGGGGISIDDGFLIMINNTVTNNTAVEDGGGIEVFGGNTDIFQSIISGNDTAAIVHELNVVAGTVNLDSFNLLGQASISWVAGTTIGSTDIVPSQSVFDIIKPLDNNGGTTETHAPALLGPAIDAILAIDCFLSDDQKGDFRPFDGNGDGVANCDIGAVESHVNPDIIFADDFD